MPWNRIFALSEGTTLLVGGALYREEGRSVFKARDGIPPLALIYDCPRPAIMRRAIRGGRQVNEYWNPFTLPSLVTARSSSPCSPGSSSAGPTPVSPPSRRSPRPSVRSALFPSPASPCISCTRLCPGDADAGSVPSVISRTCRCAGSRPGWAARRGRSPRCRDLEPYAMLRGALVDDRTLDACGLRVRLPEGCVFAFGSEVWAFGAWRRMLPGIAAEPDDPLAELAVVAGTRVHGRRGVARAHAATWRRQRS